MNAIDNLPAPDQAEMWNIPRLDGLGLLRANFVKHAFAPHAHDYYVISLIERGVQTFDHDHQNHITLPEYLICINPGEVHTGQAAVPEGFAYRALYPSAALLKQIAAPFSRHPDRLPTFPHVVVHDPALYAQFRRLHHDSEHDLSALELEERYTTFFTALVARHADPISAPRRYATARREIGRVKAYLDTHYEDKVTLADLSALVHISPYHLARLFREEIGIPPHRYLENVRIKRAQRLLAAGMPIVEAAYATGFSSQSHLTRAFKRFMGITPGKFAQQRKIV